MPDPTQAVVDPAAAAAVAAPAVTTTPAAPEFKAADAVAFLTEHGADPKSLEGVAEADLKTRYESARTVAEKAAAKAAAANKAPEKYEFTPAKDAQLDEAVVKEVTELAKEFGLTQEKAQKLYDARVATGAAHQKQLTDRIAETRKGWQDATKADKEFGGEQLAANLAIANEGMKQFGTKALADLMDATGLGDHPEVIRAFYKIGKHFQSDKTRSGAAPAGDEANRTVFSYPNSKHN